MKFLLVDDSKTMRSIQRKVLSTLYAGAEFAEAEDGIAALAALSTTPGGFDMILVDWNMPRMDGLTLVKKIREKDTKTLLVMATTEGEKPRVVEALRAGVNNYVLKPFTPEALAEKINQTLKRKAA